VREGKSVTPAFLFAALLWHEVLAAWNSAKAAGERPTPALHAAMDQVLEQQAQRLAIPRRFEATIKEIWSMQPRFEQRSGQRPFRLIEHPRFRAAFDFLWLRGQSGEVSGDIPASELADWWQRFQDADHAARERLLRPDEGVKKRKRSRSRGRKRSDDAADQNGGATTGDHDTAESQLAAPDIRADAEALENDNNPARRQRSRESGAKPGTAQDEGPASSSHDPDDLDRR
jgi:poly(A) polymerase